MQKLHLLRAAVAAFVFIAFIAGPLSSPASVAVGIGMTVAPPVTPAYAQPPCSRPNSIWAPGHWASGPAGYHWRSGTWVVAPAVGLLWTPGYWGFRSNAYYWHGGSWGQTVGFYGGINYGFGYFGHGYVGGRWYGNNFHYNSAVTNVNRTVIHNTYEDKTVVYRNSYSHVSYNGGNGGIHAEPTAHEMNKETHAHNPPR